MQRTQLYVSLSISAPLLVVAVGVWPERHFTFRDEFLICRDKTGPVTPVTNDKPSTPADLCARGVSDSFIPLWRLFILSLPAPAICHTFSPCLLPASSYRLPVSRAASYQPSVSLSPPPFLFLLPPHLYFLSSISTSCIF